MSRAKSRQNLEVCGDCGALDATWASINKGILLCTQCCSIHRSLGRHISQVKSLQKSIWTPNQIAMVCTLNNNGSNSIWEHSLLESKSLKKKPNPKDSLQIKEEFIKQKHVQCMFAFRQNYEDGLLCVENELGNQLHASVRTPNLETSFRFLILGADPNYFHNEKGSTPLHVAVKSDQKLQVELLLVFGADPTYPDAQGKTSIDYAKQNINKDLYSRLIDVQYEVTDTFSYYLTHRKPDHLNNIHFLIPQGGFESNITSLTKLRKLPNHLFEELTMDVFDEIERRATEAIWLSCVDTIDLNVVPFLPVDPTLSTTRNQGRQKLARFSTPELKSLVYDILIDTQRRHQSIQKVNMPQLREFSQISDDDPLYDSVASDEDYAVMPVIQECNEDNPTKVNNDNVIVDKLTKQLQESDSTITDLKAEVCKLRVYIESLKCENNELKTQLSQTSTKEFHSINGDSGYDSFHSIILNSDKLSNGIDNIDNGKYPKKNQRPNSMYETREGIKIPNWHQMKNQLKQIEQPRNNITHSLYASNADRKTITDCTELITKSIQQLCKSIQDRDKEDCVSSGEKVRLSVARLLSILPKETEGETVKLMADVLPRLIPECTQLQIAHKKTDSKAIENHLTNIRYYAFHLAKYTKEIVTKYSNV